MATEAGPRPPEPLGAFATVRTAIGLYRADLLELWAAMALVTVPVQLLGFILRAITLPSGSSLSHDRIYVAYGTSSGGYGAASLLAYLLAAIALLVATGTAYRILLGRYLDHPADLTTSFSFALERAVPLLWLSILVAVAAAVGFILIVLPGIYLYVALSVAVPVLMAEDHRGFSGLRRSRELISGHWWHALGCLILLIVVAGVGEAVLNLLLDPVVNGLSPHSVTGFLLISQALSAIFYVLIFPITAAVPVVLYVDLLVRKNDPHLAQLLA